MTSFQVTYRGPSAFALQAAALLADAEGVELTSATRAGDPDAPGEVAELVLILGGSTESVTAALAAAQAELPDGASVTLEQPGAIAPD